MTFHNAIVINKFELSNFKVMIFLCPNIAGFLNGIDKSWHITIVLMNNNLNDMVINILRKIYLVGFTSLRNKENNIVPPEINITHLINLNGHDFYFSKDVPVLRKIHTGFIH